MENAALLVIVTALVLVDALKVPTFHLSSTVTVVAAPASSNTAVSWAKGKLFKDGAPPEDVAHAVADQFCVPVKFQ